jgi:hypothetical protein
MELLTQRTTFSSGVLQNVEENEVETLIVCSRKDAQSIGLCL